jgi:Protein of unknown function (DUF2752)
MVVTFTFGKHRSLAAGFAAVAAGVITLEVFDPANSRIFPPCPVHYLTGWFCPGCGSLRAIHQLLQGDFRTAWAMNPLTVLLLPFIGYGLASHALFVLTGRSLPRVFLPAAWIRALCAAIVLFGILRNIPLYPFELLAPGALLRY